MQFYNEKLLFSKTHQQMLESLNNHHDWGVLAERANDAAACTQCGRCEQACTQHLNITERLAQIAEWESELKGKSGKN